MVLPNFAATFAFRIIRASMSTIRCVIVSADETVSGEEKCQMRVTDQPV